MIKLLGLCTYFLFSIIYVSGGLIGQKEAIGFQYWHNPGAFANGFRGVAQVFVFASTFYAGVEAVAVAATETRNPGVAVPLAIRQVIYRIIFVYMGVAFFFGLTCPSDADGLINGASRALKSPMTIAIQNAGWEGGVHLINAFIFISKCHKKSAGLIPPDSVQLCYQPPIARSILVVVRFYSWHKSKWPLDSWERRILEAFLIPRLFSPIYLGSCR